MESHEKDLMIERWIAIGPPFTGTATALMNGMNGFDLLLAGGVLGYSLN